MKITVSVFLFVFLISTHVSGLTHFYNRNKWTEHLDYNVLILHRSVGNLHGTSPLLYPRVYVSLNFLILFVHLIYCTDNFVECMVYIHQRVRIFALSQFNWL